MSDKPRPFAGLPTDPAGHLCAYAADIDAPGCEQLCTLHIAVDAPGWGTISLVACDRHAPIARACGDQLGEHPYEAECATTDCWAGTCVAGNRCSACREAVEAAQRRAAQP